VKSFTHLLLAWCCLIVLSSGCFAKAAEPAVPDFRSKLLVTDPLTVHQGVRNAGLELESQLKDRYARRTLGLMDLVYYSKPLKVTREDLEKLTAIFRSGGLCLPWQGPTGCDRHHGDYVLIWWRGGTREVQAIFCTHCDELRGMDGVRPWRTSLTPAGSKELTGILGKYWIPRPVVQ